MWDIVQSSMSKMRTCIIDLTYRRSHFHRREGRIYTDKSDRFDRYLGVPLSCVSLVLASPSVRNRNLQEISGKSTHLRWLAREYLNNGP